VSRTGGASIDRQGARAEGTSRESGSVELSANLKEGKQALELTGPADQAGPTTLSALRARVAQSTSADFGLQLRSADVSKTPIYLAIGLAEGTIAADGKPTDAYFGHEDPGNNALNRGFGSYQVYQHPRRASLTPADADRVQADRLAGQWSTIDAALTTAGLAPGPTRNLVAANALDAWNQAPATQQGRFGLLNPTQLAALKADLARGTKPIDAVTAWRAESYRTDSGQLDAPGLGNSMTRVRADQGRRAAAVAQGLGLRSNPTTGAPSDVLAPTPPASTGGAERGRPTLERGATGAAVSELQRRLNAAGAKVDVDGDFGPRLQAAVKAFQKKVGLSVDGVAGPATWEALSAPAKPAEPFQVGAGSKGPQVTALKEAMKNAGFYTGVNNAEMGPDGLAALRKAKAALKLGGDPEVAGQLTLDTIRAAARGGGNIEHPWLQKLATARLDNGADGSCVATTLGNMDRLGIPSFNGGTTADANNSRGAMVQMVKGDRWTSLNLPGSQARTIRSAYGTVQAQVLDADAYERLALAGKIPSGAILFQTRHGWDSPNGPYGNDMGIVRDGGRVTHNYRPMSPIIYGDAKEVVVLVPR
jgi:peptidoglycan hydrolase-like protein with peptidoglycan-binding domain